MYKFCLTVYNIDMKRLPFKKSIHLPIVIITGIIGGILQTSKNIPFVGFFLLIPLICLCFKAETFGRFFKTVFSFFISMTLIECSFILSITDLLEFPPAIKVLATVLTWLLLSVYLALLLCIPILLFYRIRTDSVLDIFTFSLLVCSGEYLSEFMPVLAFPWSGMWGLVYSDLNFLQTASILGQRFTSFLVVGINAAFAYVYIQKIKNVKALVISSLAVLTYGSFSLYGIVKSENINHTSYKNSQEVMIVQTSKKSLEKRKTDPVDELNQIMETIEKENLDNVSLIILPETAVRFNITQNPQAFSRISDDCRKYNLTVLAGCYYSDKRGKYNAFVSLDGSSYSDIHLKRYLVPFGEVTPFKTKIRTNSLVAGSGTNYPLNTKIGKVGGLICFESMFSHLGSSLANNGADFIAIPTNDSWFDNTSAREVHFRHSVMRAIETGLPVFRAGNCGISAVILPNGKSAQRISSDNFKIIISKIPANSEKSRFCSHCFIMPFVCLGLCIFSVLVIIYSFVRSIIKRRAE